MDIKKSLKDVIVLVVICVVFGAALAATNSVTAPIIQERLDNAANEAYFSVMDGATGFDTVDLSEYQNLPTSVIEAKKEKSGMGYAIKLEAKGYASGMVIIVGVSSNGVVTGATCISSNETWGLEDNFGDKTVGKDMNTIVDVEAGATSLTINGYRGAVKDALTAAAIFGGANIDGRPEEVKFAEKLDLALPAANGEFEKVVLLAALDGIDSVYEAKNGEGYVCLIGTDSTGTFIGVDKNGAAIGDVSAVHKALAEAAVASIKANVAEDVDLTPYQDNEIIKNLVNSVQKTGSDTYIVEIKTTENYTESTPIVIKVVIDADGKIVDVQTVSHSETDNIGGLQLQDGAYNSNFIGKDQTGAGEVDTVSGATVTTKAYKAAINNAFNVVSLLSGSGDVDFRTEEEKFADAIKDALPAGEGVFTKYFRVEIIEGFDSIYVADNGAGYVCVIGTDSTGTFIGVGADGVAIGDNENNALAEAAVATITATELTNVDFSEYKNSSDKNIKKVFRKIQTIQKTATGNYIFTISCDGFGILGDHYYSPSGNPFIIKVCISADGKVIDVVTVEESETPTIGGAQLQDGAYNSNFIGKDQTGANDVDIVAQCTLTTQAFKTGVTSAFGAFQILTGGTN